MGWWVVQRKDQVIQPEGRRQFRTVLSNMVATYHVATYHLKCNWSELRCINIKHSLDFEDLGGNTSLTFLY